jgi:hypothetical protein
MRAHATREQIRNLIAKLFDAEPFLDEMVGYIERGAPALLHYIERKASGRLSTGRAAYGDFLRSTPEPIFDYLLERALDFFRRPAIAEAPATQDPELYALAGFLWFDEHEIDESEIDDYTSTDDQMRALMDRLAWLIVVEEQHRGGAGVWQAHSRMLLRATTGVPLRLPAPELMTPH